MWGSDVLLPATNPSCPGDSKPLSRQYLTSLLLNIVRKSFPRQDIREMPLRLPGLSLAPFLCIHVIREISQSLLNVLCPVIMSLKALKAWGMQ